MILRDRFVYVADPANPRLRDGRLTAEDLAALPHATARFPDPGSDPATIALLRRGISPNVALTTAGWLPLPFLVAGTDLVAAVPERLARRVSGAAGVTIDPPFGTIELVEAAWWHPLHNRSGAHLAPRHRDRGRGALGRAPVLPGQRQPGRRLKGGGDSRRPAR